MNADSGKLEKSETAAPEAETARRHGGPSGERLMRLATYAAVATASLLIVVKLIAWLMTDSVSLLSTLIDSLLDVAASMVNLLAVRHALTPPDREHRFGHGKAEPLAGLAQATFICGSALFLLIEAGQRLFAPKALANTEIGIAVMVFSIAMTLALVAFQRYVIRRTRSVAIEADSLHYFGDVLVNASVIVALLLSAQLGLVRADAVFGIVIAFYILWNAWQIAKGSLDMLMDRELPEEERQRIRSIVESHPSVMGMHDLRTRVSGPKTFIQLHLELNGSLNLYHAHTISETVEADLMAQYPDAEIIIHEDPHGAEGEAQAFH